MLKILKVFLKSLCVFTLLSTSTVTTLSAAQFLGNTRVQVFGGFKLGTAYVNTPKKFGLDVSGVLGVSMLDLLYLGTELGVTWVGLSQKITRYEQTTTTAGIGTSVTQERRRNLYLIPIQIFMTVKLPIDFIIAPYVTAYVGQLSDVNVGDRGSLFGDDQAQGADQNIANLRSVVFTGVVFGANLGAEIALLPGARLLLEAGYRYSKPGYRSGSRIYRQDVGGVVIRGGIVFFSD